MIYRLLVCTEKGENLASWRKKGFPERKKLKDEKLKQIAMNIAPPNGIKESFKSLDFGSLTTSFLFKDKTTYVIVSDKNDPIKARKKALKDISREMRPLLEDLKEGKTLENIDKFMKRKIKSYTRLLPGLRSGTAGSTFLGFFGGLIFIFAFSFIGRRIELQISPVAKMIQKTFSWISVEWLIFIIFFTIFAVVTGIVTGIASGKGSGGFLGSYLIMMLTFSIPVIFEEWPSLASKNLTEFLLDYYSIVSPISRFYLAFIQENITVLWQILLLLGISFAFFSALISAGIGHLLDSRNLLGEQISKKPTKKVPKEKKRDKEEKLERVPEEEESEEEVEIGEKEVEELEELFGEE